MSGAVNQRVTSTATKILQGSGKLTIDGIDVGGYVGGVKVTLGQTETFIDSDWQLGSVDSEIKGVTFEVSTELEEATLENLAAAWGMYSSSVSSVHVSSSKIMSIKPESSMIEHQLVFEGMSALDRTKLRTFTIPKAVRVGSSATTLNRGVKTTVPVTFRCLMTTDGQGQTGSFGTVADAVA
jgi:hypothetical protein